MANLAKQELRKQLQAMRPASSAGLAQRLIELTRELGAKTIASYVSTSKEPDVSEFNSWVQEHGTLLLPRVTGDQLEFAAGDLAPGAFGLREPTGPALAVSEIEFLVVPALAVDVHGNRLGKGKGFYDRLLVEVQAVSCAVVFDHELFDGLEVEDHDQRVDYVVTPTRTIRTSS